ncbi:purple acid phosphatase family protein [Limnoglobus roseus]|uniref:Metallophosphoesterase n=1 Tax=Limnoglobus roseus TaxID=2598579 RepID=A0A5C1A8V2_9BACT|nr:metallophosphoesterase family protein [Limnoglobus roseus]QEL14456.1 metallophosphoesterase [Limnoglobus roseus]
MFSPHTRRAFLGSALAGLAANLAPAQDVKPASTKSLEEAPFQPSTLFLTWHRDPTTTMVVQWVGTRGETPDTTVYYGETDGDSWEKQKPIVKPYHPDTDFKVFRAELTGLTPNTEYDFKIGKNLSPTYKFRTMPAKATDTISFISGGDAGVNPHAIANNIQAARQNPDFVVIGGDLAYENGKSTELHLAFLRNYSRTMIGKGGRLIPLVAGIGNHETQGGYNQTRERAPFFYSLFDGLYPETGYNTLDFGDYLSLVMLDTGHTSAIGGEQADWLDKELKEREDHPNVMVVNHVPAYPSYRSMTGSKAGTGTGEENRQYWVPLFEHHRVPVVLEHHDHTFKRTKPLINGLAHDNGVLYLGDGSWGRVRAPQRPEKLSHLAIAKEDYHLTLHRLQGADRYHLALDENGRVMDVSHSGQRLKGQFAVGGPLPKPKGKS